MVNFPAIFMLKMIYSIISGYFCIKVDGGFIEAEDLGPTGGRPGQAQEGGGY
jgi:hypothetical protein